MCGRFFIDDGSTYADAALIIEAMKLSPGSSYDIYPSSEYAVLTSENSRVYKIKKWGFRTSNESGLIINARAESAAQKPLFRNCLKSSRCIIKMSGFYEWDKYKNKYWFTSENPNLINAAGLHNKFGDGEYFTIITTSANSSVAGIHERMPLILNSDESEIWLNDSRYAEKLLETTPGPLLKTAALPHPVQQRFFFE